MVRNLGGRSARLRLRTRARTGRFAKHVSERGNGMSGHLSPRHERTPNAHPHGGLNPYAFVAQGYRVFPCRANKAPRNTGWQQQATTDPTQIEQWLADGVRVFGLPTGAENNLFVLDLDTDKQTGTRIGEVAALELPWGDALLALPHTTTPTGGRHIYFRHFDGARNTQGRLGQGIDTRGEGGYVVAPGSQSMAGKYRGLSYPRTNCPTFRFPYGRLSFHHQHRPAG